MLGSIFVGLSGMNAYSRGLQTISSNVVNLNSQGFKATTVNFSDLFSGADADLRHNGGGVRLADGLLDLRQGDLRQTDGDLDLGIQGDGFLVLQQDGKQYYLRTGQFTVNADGFIVLGGTEKRLTVLDTAGQAMAVNVNDKRTNAPVATTKVTFADNLSSTGTTASVSNITVHDAAGNSYVWRLNLAATGPSAPGEWTATVLDAAGATLATATLKFTGSIIDPSTSTITVNYTPTGASATVPVLLDFTAVTSFSSGSSSAIRASDIDGNPVGTLVGVTVTEGKVKVSYSNGEFALLGDVAIADFDAPQDLRQTGDGMFTNPDQQLVRLTTSKGAGVGELLARRIEASNVNLSEEFGDLILIQRGFQASSQVVSVSNDMIQELFGVRGRG